MLVDKIQHRYSWTDEIIQDLPVCRFWEIIDAIEFAEEQERKEKMFHTWQLLTAQGLDKNFDDYYRSCYKVSSKQQNYETEKAKDIEAKVDAVLAKKRAKGGG